MTSIKPITGTLETHYHLIPLGQLTLILDRPKRTNAIYISKTSRALKQSLVFFSNSLCLSQLSLKDLTKSQQRNLLQATSEFCVLEDTTWYVKC